MLQHHLQIKDWYERHIYLGGYTASCYVDWNIIHNPLNDFVRMLEEFKQVPSEKIAEFMEADVTDNSMHNRNLLEDMSKIGYLVEEVLYETLMFHPQVIHEPWYNRYRIHPGSGRAIAMWLAGVEQFKTIYTHFDGMSFVPPGHTIKHNSWKTFANEIVFPATGLSTSIDIERFSAFPKNIIDYNRTKNKDSEWKPDTISDRPWEFIVYSEGKNFLKYKTEWRSYALMMHDMASHSIVQIGRTIFEFNKDKVVKVIRNGSIHNILTSDE